MCCVMVMMQMGLPVHAMEKVQEKTIESEIVVPQSDTYKWVYKTIDGQKYKRLWNINKSQWVTDWIAC